MVPMPYFQRQLLSDGTTILSPYLSGKPGIQNQMARFREQRQMGIRDNTRCKIRSSERSVGDFRSKATTLGPSV